MNPDRLTLLRPVAGLREALLLRADLEAARAAWLAEIASDSAETSARCKSDFLMVTNAAGEHLDFHSLRHTYGAWQILAGVPIQVVKERMRHSTITLTMDTYGHLIPGQKEQAAQSLAAYMRGSDDGSFGENESKAPGDAGLRGEKVGGVRILPSSGVPDLYQIQHRSTPSGAGACRIEAAAPPSTRASQTLKQEDLAPSYRSAPLETEVPPAGFEQQRQFPRKWCLSRKRYAQSDAPSNPAWNG